MNSPICLRCGTELALSALACPACAALRYADQLKTLAVDAESATRAGSIDAARAHWTQALALLPANSQQHATVQQRIAELSNSDRAAPAVTTTAERS